MCVLPPSLPQLSLRQCAFCYRAYHSKQGISLSPYGTCLYVRTFVYVCTYRNEQIQDIAGVDIHIRRTIMLSTTPCLPPYISVYTLPPSRQLSLRQCALLSPSLPQQARCLLSLSLSLFLYGTCMYVCTFVYARTYRNEQIQDIAGVVIHIRRTIMLSTSPCLPPYMTYTLPPSFPPSLPASCGSLPFAIELTSTVAEAVCVLSPSLPQQARHLPISLRTRPPGWHDFDCHNMM